MSTKKSGSKSRSRKTNRCAVEFKLRAVQLFTEEGYSAEMVARSVKAKAVELKKEDPSRGVRRIAHLLERFHLMKASPETVRRTLKEAGT